MSDPIVEEMMAEPEPEVAEAEPVAEPVAEPEAEPVEEAVEEPEAEPAAEAVEEPAPEAAAEPAVEEPAPEPEVKPQPTAEEIAKSIKAMLTRDMESPTGTTEERLSKAEERIELLIKLVVPKNFRNVFD